jgi:GT2 family glycosyltransferase
LFKNSRLINRMRLTGWDRRDIRETDTIPGSFMFTTYAVLEQVGYMDEKFLIFFSDQDLCRKIKDAGWKVYHNGKTSLIHLKAQTTKKIPIYQLMKISYRDMRYYYRKHFSILWQPILYFFANVSLFYYWLTNFCNLSGNDNHILG